MTDNHFTTQTLNRVYLVAPRGLRHDVLIAFDGARDAYTYSGEHNSVHPWSTRDVKARAVAVARRTGGTGFPLLFLVFCGEDIDPDQWMAFNVKSEADAYAEHGVDLDVHSVPLFILDHFPTVPPRTEGATGAVASEAAWSVTADIVLFAHRAGVPHVLLVQRRWAPFEGCWATPGGFVESGESPLDAAHRELREETGMTGVELVQVGAYGDPGRDERGRVLTVAHTAVLAAMVEPVAGDDARAARWVPLHDVLTAPDSVAFDHHQIITDAARLVLNQP